METLTKLIYNRLQAHQDLMLVTVMSSAGSTPRGAGAHMVVDEAGYVAGTIGGGKIEHRCVQEGMVLLQQAASKIEDFNLTPNAGDLGMLCGGKAKVLFTYLAAADTLTNQVLEQVLIKQSVHESAWLIFQLRGNQVKLGFYSETLQFVGLTIPKDRLQVSAMSYTDQGATYFVEPISTSAKVYIFGAGHVGRALAAVLPPLNFYTEIWDDRAGLLTKQYLPSVNKMKLVDFEQPNLTLPLTKQDYGIVVSSSHKTDARLEALLLQTPAQYIGVLASKHKIALHTRALREAGFTQTDTDRIHWPIGLAIGADSPQEIAISVAAELVQQRATQRQVMAALQTQTK
ncbi:MAG: XdhC family protein [Lactobacillus sp.]|jgi:xanthine dehydrogenase accessory factor|nr:XdhC family protein [Lactobacillus sp.]